jgi:hypothetical protein
MGSGGIAPRILNHGVWTMWRREKYQLLTGIETPLSSPQGFRGYIYLAADFSINATPKSNDERERRRI